VPSTLKDLREGGYNTQWIKERSSRVANETPKFHQQNRVRLAHSFSQQLTSRPPTRVTSKNGGQLPNYRFCPPARPDHIAFCLACKANTMHRRVPFQLCFCPKSLVDSQRSAINGWPVSDSGGTFPSSCLLFVLIRRLYVCRRKGPRRDSRGLVLLPAPPRFKGVGLAACL